MRKTITRLSIATVTVLAALLTVGVVAASAHGGPGGLAGGASVSTLVTQAATQLGVSRATLVTAIQNSAATHLSDAAADGDITSTQATNLTTEAQDNLTVAYTLSETKTVASNLSITTAALNTAFQAARKAAVEAQPNMSRVHILLGRCYEAARNSDQAKAEFKQAAQLDPSDPLPHYLLAQTYRELRQPQESGKELSAFEDLSKAEKNRQLSGVDRKWRAEE